jgi:hypothetical protein
VTSRTVVVGQPVWYVNAIEASQGAFAQVIPVLTACVWSQLRGTSRPSIRSSTRTTV